MKTDIYPSDVSQFDAKSMILYHTCLLMTEFGGKTYIRPDFQRSFSGNPYGENKIPAVERSEIWFTTHVQSSLSPKPANQLHGYKIEYC